MQKWLIVSDSHGLNKELKELFDTHKDYKIFHCGDYCINDKLLKEYNVNYVRGNCDFSRHSLEEIIDIDGFKILLTHGHKYDVKRTYTNIYYRALELNADYVFFGHTHRQSNFCEDGITFLNPGSLKDSLSYIEVVEGIITFKRM